MTSPLTFDKLSAHERLLMWALRISYAPSISHEATGRALEQGFRLANIEAALPPFNAYSSTVATSLLEQQLTVQLHCPTCPSISLDEWNMVRVIASLQSGEALLARRQLRWFLPDSGLQPCFGSGSHLAAALTRLDFHLPRRTSAAPYLQSSCEHHEHVELDATGQGLPAVLH